jgi:hypothetical protein
VSDGSPAVAIPAKLLMLAVRITYSVLGTHGGLTFRLIIKYHVIDDPHFPLSARS